MAGVIVWINGPFGVGKTTTAVKLVERDSRLRLFDPEWVGYMLANNLADQDFSDFQRLPLWRKLTPVVAHEVATATGQELVCVQTVLDQSYWDELAAGMTALGERVVHVLLDADAEVLGARIIGDTVESGAQQWRLEHLEKYFEQKPWMTERAQIVVDTSALEPAEVAQRVLERLGAELS